MHVRFVHSCQKSSIIFIWPKVTSTTGDDEAFDIMCQMLAPLNDGHVELEAKVSGSRMVMAVWILARLRR